LGLSQATVSVIKIVKNYKGYWTWVDKHNEKIKAKRAGVVQEDLLPENMAKKALEVLIKYFSKK
jgi:hypothetical protein